MFCVTMWCTTSEFVSAHKVSWLSVGCSCSCSASHKISKFPYEHFRLLSFSYGGFDSYYHKSMSMRRRIHRKFMFSRWTLQSLNFFAYRIEDSAMKILRTASQSENMWDLSEIWFFNFLYLGLQCPDSQGSSKFRNSCCSWNSCPCVYLTSPQSNANLQYPVMQNTTHVHINLVEMQELI